LAERRYGSARSDIFAERDHGDHPRRTVDATENANGGKQGLTFLELDLLRVVPPVYL
jgi:hypothetical protein